MIREVVVLDTFQRWRCNFSATMLHERVTAVFYKPLQLVIINRADNLHLPENRINNLDCGNQSFVRQSAACPGHLFVLADWVRWMIEYSLYCQNVGWAQENQFPAAVALAPAHLRFVREHVFYCLGTLVSAISGALWMVYQEESFVLEFFSFLMKRPE